MSEANSINKPSNMKMKILLSEINLSSNHYNSPKHHISNLIKPKLQHPESEARHKIATAPVNSTRPIRKKKFIEAKSKVSI